jgi:hypothetical protein
MQAIKKLFTFNGYLILAAIAVGAIAGGYFVYDRQTELSYLTASGGWKWHDYVSRIQIRELKEQVGIARMTLRRAYPDKRYAVHAGINQNNLREVAAYFEAECEPASKIVTSQEWPDGEPKVLYCTRDGKSLLFAAQLTSPEACYQWEAGIDDYQVSESFCDWDFTKLRQQQATREE